MTTLWTVNDAASAALMKRFYERLVAGDDMAAALAKMTMTKPAKAAPRRVKAHPNRLLPLLLPLPSKPRRLPPRRVPTPLHQPLPSPPRQRLPKPPPPRCGKQQPNRPRLRLLPPLSPTIPLPPNCSDPQTSPDTYRNRRFP